MTKKEKNIETAVFLWGLTLTMVMPKLFDFVYDSIESWYIRLFFLCGVLLGMLWITMRIYNRAHNE